MQRSPQISASTSQNLSNSHQVLLKAATLDHRRLSQLHTQLWALCSTHQLCQRRKGWVASPVCPCFFGEVFWESGNMREQLFFFVHYERWEDEGRAEWQPHTDLLIITVVLTTASCCPVLTHSKPEINSWLVSNTSFVFGSEMQPVKAWHVYN